MNVMALPTVSNVFFARWSMPYCVTRFPTLRSCTNSLGAPAERFTGTGAFPCFGAPAWYSRGMPIISGVRPTVAKESWWCTLRSPSYVLRRIVWYTGGAGIAPACGCGCEYCSWCHCLRCSSFRNRGSSFLRMSMFGSKICGVKPTVSNVLRTFQSGSICFFTGRLACNRWLDAP